MGGIARDAGLNVDASLMWAPSTTRWIARATKGLEMMKLIGIVLVLLAVSTTCSAQIGSIESRWFYDHERGIGQLTRSLTLLNPSFFDLKPEERNHEFDRIAGLCSASQNESTVIAQEKQIVCSVITAIADDLKDFVKARGILVLIDVSYVPVMIDGDDHDITDSFIARYNQRHS